MSIDISPFRVKPGRKVDLKKWPTSVKPFYGSKDDYESMLADHVKKLAERQQLLYAYDRYALLLIFQSLDAAGKDGAIKHVMSGVNPQGCQVYSFKHPSPEELDHDFMWRTTRALPERGRIGIFNRSYYEEVLIVRVHPEILQSQRLPEEALEGHDVWRRRYQSISDFEKHLHRNGTRVVKFYLHVSREEQRKRFLARLDNPAKNWKFSEADLAERACWKDYRQAYEDCLEATSTDRAPWYVVPADDKATARLIVSQVILSVLKGLKMRYPEPDRHKQKELAAIRRKLLRDR